MTFFFGAIPLRCRGVDAAKIVRQCAISSAGASVTSAVQYKGRRGAHTGVTHACLTWAAAPCSASRGWIALLAQRYSGGDEAHAASSATALSAKRGW